jgi:hypothetical protein
LATLDARATKYWRRASAHNGGLFRFLATLNASTAGKCRGLSADNGSIIGWLAAREWGRL